MEPCIKCSPQFRILQLSETMQMHLALPSSLTDDVDNM